jgi:hypothetical protein
MGKKKKSENLPAVISHFAFGEQWLEKDEYIGFVPSDGTNWRSEKESFYARASYVPKFMNLTNGKETISVYVHGFRIPGTPPVIAFGSDATRGRVVLCQLIANKEHIAIHY